MQNLEFIKASGKILLIFFSIFVLLGARSHKKNSPDSTDFYAYMDEITYSFIQQVEKEYGFECNAIGGSAPYDVLSFRIGFAATSKASKDEARELEVRLIEKCLNLINAHEKIRPFLRNYPFKPADVEISVNFLDKKGQPQSEDSIYRIIQINNNILYSIYDHNKETFTQIAKEPYHEAYKLVHKMN